MSFTLKWQHIFLKITQVNHIKIWRVTKPITGGFHQTRATNYANFCICIRFLLFFAILSAKKINILTKETNVNECNECNEKTTIWMTRTIKKRQFMWRCGHSFHCSRIKRLQRVVHWTPTNDHSENNGCVWANLRGVCRNGWNGCIYFLAAKIYILLSNGREANLSKLSFLSFKSAFLCVYPRF